MSDDCCGYFDFVAIALGVYALLPKLYGVYLCLYKSFFMKEHDLLARYGDGNKSWVVVTGCTSGIGEELAKRFAQKGFNVVLISRSLERLQRVAKEIAFMTNGGVQTKIVVADFAKGGEQLHMYEGIYEQVKDLDIAILVNNAGVLFNGYYRDVPMSQIMEQSIVNTYPYVLLTKVLLQKLL